MVGIYKIENKINGHVYIGQSVHIKRRWQNEIRRAFNPGDISYNYPLSSAIRKYGVNNFDFSVIEECSAEELDEKERYYIYQYNSYYNGYNQTLGGDGSCHGREYKPKIIGVINDLKNTDMFHRDIAEKWQISVEMVQGINTGRYWYSDYEDYPLQKLCKRNSHQPIKIYYCIDCGKEVTKGADRCIECARLVSRKVARPSREELHDYLLSIRGNFLEAGRHYGVSDNTIRKWCKAYGIPSKSVDYKEKKVSKILGTTLSKQVGQYDVESDILIKIYASISDAARAVGAEKGSGHISAACKGARKTAYGYKWQYIE